MKHFMINNYTMLLGENMLENKNLIEKCDSNYIWLCVNDFPSINVIIESHKVPPKILESAGHFCFHNTNHGNTKSATITTSKISNVILSENSVMFKTDKDVQSFTLNFYEKHS